MKNFSPGLSDSIASVIADPAQCPHCDSSSHIAGGLCVGCLLQAGLAPEDECAAEALVSALAEITLPDKNWRLGNYEILEEIGRGGMGVIYRARQRHSRRIVALKRVLGYHADSRETLARFRREAQAAASLDHPNILPIYEVSESEDGLPFFSMKFAPGGSLQEVGPALKNDPRQCVALVAKVARAVQHAHAKGILHRDLKPGNILLDAYGEPLVSDFGLAKWLDTTSDLTRTLTIFGTPGYIAPEQASGPAAELKPAADVYSLGAILFDLLAGRPPFLGSHALSVIRQASETTAPKLRSLSKVADRDLETICARCLEREPTARYHSANDLAEDLERWLEGRSIIARPVYAPVKLWRWVRRNTLLTAAIIVCATLGATVVARYFHSDRLENALRSNQTAFRSVAILPFLDLDRDAPDPNVAISVANYLGAEISKLGPARVIAFTGGGAGALGNVQETGRGANVRAVLSGTYRTVDAKCRVSLRLMNGATGEVLFARRFDTGNLSQAPRHLAQNEGLNIYSILSATDWSGLTVAELDVGMRNPTTRELILSGYTLMSRFTVTDLDRAASCFKKAILAEPQSALAHSYLSLALGLRTHFISDDKLLANSESEARQALSLSPESCDAHRALSGVMMQQGRFEEALGEALQAIEFGGHEQRLASLIANSYRALGRPDRALRWYRMARQWQRSNSSEHDSGIGDCLTELGDDTGAEIAYRRALDLHPDLPDGWVGLAHLRVLQGNFDDARLIHERNAAAHADAVYTKESLAQIEFFARDFGRAEQLYTVLADVDSRAGADFYGAVSCKSALGRLRLAAGDKDAANRLLEQALADETATLRRSPTHGATLYRLSAIESCLGHEEAAIKYLTAATQHGWLDYRSMSLDPRFDRIRESESFKRLLADLNTNVETLRRQQPAD